ncbi:hypothetical protein B4N89_27390 [Embleya scabrispora]|uniref:Uncharacterized protein n=1 Tax=Embleya scabrispora TaxID=159449 RepID=A0A1T3P516_9ACTN|nr:hypothetical protein [Embleya scabrispora]OPC84153.1 hypothetical protein B4N89_27390 [Embleya scabrispora]
MTTHYTDDDLYREAARQHHKATQDPDYVGIGEQMADEKVGDTDTTWDELDEEEFDLARTGIDELLHDAADMSRWAIDAGADHLEPHERTLAYTAKDGRPLIRIHFAFADEIPEKNREGCIEAFTNHLQMLARVTLG